MTTLKASCDICGEIIEGEIFEDYDNIQKCHKCYLKDELYFEESQYKDKMDWLKSTHIKDLKKIQQKILSLRKELKPYNKTNSADTKNRAAD